jgi:hypothetical protein
MSFWEENLHFCADERTGAAFAKTTKLFFHPIIPAIVLVKILL